METEALSILPEVIQQTPMFSETRGDVRPWKALKVIGDGLVMDAEGKEYNLNSLDKISEMALGKVCVFAEDTHNFNDIIKYIGDQAIMQIATNRKAKTDGLIISAQDNLGREFNMRKGNKWGWIKNIPDIFEDNISVKDLDKQYGEILSILRANSFDLSMLSSAPKMSQGFFHKNLKGIIPTFNDLDRTHWERAYYSTKGGRMEMSRCGSFKKVYDYDMVSAYGSILRDLLCISPYYMTWKSSRTYIKEADFAFCRCVVNMPPISDGLIPFRMDMGSIFFPYGRFSVWLAKPEIDILMLMGVDIRVIEGSYGIAREKLYPFRDIVDHLWNLREYEQCYRSIKKMLSMSWGKFLSEYGNGKVSSLWNPIYAAHITSTARARLLELTQLVGENMVAFSIDGFSSKRSLPSNLLSDDLGGMKLHYTGEMTSYTDFFRDIGQKKTWKITDDGVFFEGSGYVSLMGVKTFRYEDIGKPIQVSRCIPFGSTKRQSTKLQLKDIRDNEIALSPPNISDVYDMYEKTLEQDIMSRNSFFASLM